jgi:hypothetical protein
MPYHLASLTLSAMTQLGATLRRIGAGAGSVEEVAQCVVRLLYDVLGDSATGARACVLARFYFTIQHSNLDEDLRAFGTRLMKGSELQPDTRCLTLLATAGEKPEWNSRKKSEGHKTIPLPSEQAFQAIPMVSQLIMQLGIDVATVLKPDPSLVLEMEQKTYNVFFVQEAVGSPFIPAQKNFVIPYKVRSVLGFGGLLPSGDIYVVLPFTRVSTPRDIADTFRNAAMNLKVALLPFVDRPVFGIPHYEQQ